MAKKIEENEVQYYGQKLLQIFVINDFGNRRCDVNNFASAYVSATENIDLSKSGEASLTLQLPAVSDSVRLYQIAEYDSESKITMIEEAEDIDITIDSDDNAATLGSEKR